jgi:hypothetical protein
MQEIQLSNGMVARVDDSDFESLNQKGDHHELHNLS